MTRSTIHVHNIKCGGCANSITQAIAKFGTYQDIKVNVTDGMIELGHDASDDLTALKAKLASMGYPEDDPTMVQNVKSFVSCAIGRVTK